MGGLPHASSDLSRGVSGLGYFVVAVGAGFALFPQICLYIGVGADLALSGSVFTNSYRQSSALGKQYVKNLHPISSAQYAYDSSLSIMHFARSTPWVCQDFKSLAQRSIIPRIIPGAFPPLSWMY